MTIDADSTSHRLIFLYCCQILGAQQSDREDSASWTPIQKLRQYAMKYCLRHWQHIDCDRHEQVENIEVCSALYNLLANRYGLAATLEAERTTLDNIVRKTNIASIEDGYQAFAQTWQRWSKMMDELVEDPVSNEDRLATDKDTRIQMYWKGSCDDAFLPLFEAHMDNWLDGWRKDWNPEMARVCSLAVLNRTSYKLLSKVQISNEYWERWISFHEDDIEPDHDDWWNNVVWNIRTTYLMRTLYRHPLTSTAPYATALVLNFTIEQALNARYHELLLAAEKCDNPVQKAEIFVRLSKECYVIGIDDINLASDDDKALCRDNGQQAVDYVNSAIDMISDKTSEIRHSALLRRASLLGNLNKLLYYGDMDTEIKESFREIRAFSRGRFINGESVLWKELLHHVGNHVQVMDFFVDLTPVQRLSLLIYGSGEINFVKPKDLNGALLPAAVLTKRVGELLGIYHEMLGDLRLGSCEIIWYDTLIRSHKAVRNMQQASHILKQASIHVLTTSYIQVGSSHFYADDLVANYINLASDILYQQFRSSDEPDVKTRFLQNAEAILFQPLPQSVRLTSTSMIPYLIVLARIQKPTGTFQKYQDTLQRALDMCWANLKDESIYNDMQNLLYLAKILALEPLFGREAEIAGSSQLYYLGKFSELWKFGDRKRAVEQIEIDEVVENLGYSKYHHLHREGALRSSFWFATQPCARSVLGHKCVGVEGWQTWETPMYICLCCTTSILCQDCYEERIRRNNASGEVEDGIDFCCDAGEYIKAPMDGWKGIRDGKIYIENEEPLEFNVFLEQVREKWRQWWKDFWKG